MLTARLLIAAAGLALMLPAPAQAGDKRTDEGETARALGNLKDQLGDPARQEQLAGMVAAMSHALLDLPLAPIAKAMAQAGADAGVATADKVDPNATLRSMAPGAGQVPDRVARELPRAMDAMAAMAGGIEAMTPALAEMAARMKDALDAADPVRD